VFAHIILARMKSTLVSHRHPQHSCYSTCDRIETVCNIAQRRQDFANILPSNLNISQTSTDTAIVTIEGEQESVPKLLNGTSFNDLEWPLSQISKSRYYSTSNNSKMVQDGAIVTMADFFSYADGGLLKSHTWSVELHHFQWPWTTLNQDFKVRPFFDAEYLRNG